MADNADDADQADQADQADRGLRFMRSWRELVNSSERNRRAVADALGVGLSELVAMGHLYADGPMTAGRLAEHLGLTTGSTTALIDRAQRAGYVTRQGNPDDRRSVLVALTPAGTHAVAWTYEETDTRISSALRQVPAGLLEHVTTVMREVAAALEEPPAPFRPPSGAVAPTVPHG